MKPPFLDKMDQALNTNQHVILDFNTTDRIYWSEQNLGPLSMTMFLGQYYASQGFRVAEYAPAKGLKELNLNIEAKRNKKPLVNISRAKDPVEALQKIGTLLREKDAKWIVFIQYCEHLAPQDSLGVSAASVPGQIQTLEMLHRFSFDDAITTGASRVVLVSYGALPADLITRAHGYRLIQVDLPSKAERLAFIGFIEGLSENNRFGELEPGLKAEELAVITGGMPLIGIESLYLSAGHQKRPITREQVRMAKAISIAQLAQDLLAVSEPEISFAEVAGLKSAVAVMKKVVTQIKSAQSGVPQTVLFQGEPGCGKTHLAQATAHELRWPMIEFRNIRGSYVGQSERQLELVITIVEQLQPVVLLFDEIDQLIGQRGAGASGDSGTSERLLARMFNWLGSMEHRGKILFIGTSNRPDLLDAALLDRFRVSIPFLHPTQSDLVELIPLLLSRFERSLAKQLSLNKAAEILVPLKPSGRSLQEIIIHAGLIADETLRQVGSTLDEKHLLLAAQDYLPIENPLEMEFIRLTALSMCSANSFLPWMDGTKIRSNNEVPQSLIADGIIDKKTGRLDRTKLHQKLNELAQTRQMSRIMR
ncbi:putative AAA ATPase chaperone [Desulfosarcina variabilis str. Montpellier]|uniref:ATP-binding protein n=1 Tax=Desulfosarcina variabilis TaxID=2300 RepID=UPI003AFAB371